MASSKTQMSAHDKINGLRKEIDKIDDLILKLINERTTIVDGIMETKKEYDLLISDPKREDEIFGRLTEKYPHLNKLMIHQIYSIIFSYGKKNRRSEESGIHDYLKIRPIIIAGPCAVETESQINEISDELSSMGIKLLRGGAFKPRTSPDSFQGLGEEGLKHMRKAADKNNMFIVSEVLNDRQLDSYYDLIDVIQIGSRNMTAYGFLKYVGEVTSLDKKPVLLKRGMSSTINELLNSAKYILNEGNPNVILCLRGIRTFEQIDSKFRFTPDLAGIIELKEKTDLPVIYDPSHSAGDSKYVTILAKAALGLGADGLVIECHTDPSKALVDGKQSIQPSQLKKILDYIKD